LQLDCLQSESLHKVLPLLAKFSSQELPRGSTLAIKIPYWLDLSDLNRWTLPPLCICGFQRLTFNILSTNPPLVSEFSGSVLRHTKSIIRFILLIGL
jgi:hypothetical protein